MSNHLSYRIRHQMTPQQRRDLFLSNKRYQDELLAFRFRGRLMDVYHPITLCDGSYWRNSKWNPPIPATMPIHGRPSNR